MDYGVAQKWYILLVYGVRLFMTEHWTHSAIIKEMHEYETHEKDQKQKTKLRPK